MPASRAIAAASRVRFLVVAVLAALGAILLAVIVAMFWREAGDDLAYWLGGYRLANGLPVYPDPSVAFEDFAFHYVPPVAQVLAPIAAVVAAVPFLILFRAVLLLALWDLAGRRMLDMLAMLAFVPLAYSLRVENVEILMAIAIVYGLARWPWMFLFGGIVKVSPGLGLVYLALQRRWRDVVISAALGALIVAVSYVLAPDLWRDWLHAIGGRSDVIGNSIVPLPYSVRAIAGFVLTIVAGLIGRRRGELLLVVAVTIANPGLSLQGFAVLAAVVPVWRAGPEGLLARRDAHSAVDPATSLSLTASRD
ncbi:MAG TPA: glycosyltransferase 87 family protein [Candidatus Limnocylindrales bacterium]|nr:glycosyltransferase 87 family protein [Candidatus Limnocylindrales bacterium]